MMCSLSNNGRLILMQSDLQCPKLLNNIPCFTLTLHHNSFPFTIPTTLHELPSDLAVAYTLLSAEYNSYVS